MKISIEFKDKRYRITHGKLEGVGNTPKEALDALVAQFADQLKKLFNIQ